VGGGGGGGRGVETRSEARGGWRKLGWEDEEAGKMGSVEVLFQDDERGL